jgi:hypothetical protein
MVNIIADSYPRYLADVAEEKVKKTYNIGRKGRKSISGVRLWICSTPPQGVCQTSSPTVVAILVS